MSTMTASMLQLLLLVLAAPLAQGLIAFLKARLQNRKGPSPLQPWRDMLKLLRKEAVIAEQASWIFRAAPYLVFAATVAAASALPVMFIRAPLAEHADVIVLVALLALARFWLSLAAMDIGTAFGGLGASREMTLSALAEPAMLLAIFVLSTSAGSTDLSRIAEQMLAQPIALHPSLAFALAAMLIVAVAETGRIPVDNPSTHLELTMIHEALVLEYSGRHLALLEWASSIKLLLFATLLIDLFAPWGIAVEPSLPLLLFVFVLWLGKLVVIFAALALLETYLAKLRLFAVPELLFTGFVLAVLGLIARLALEGQA